MDYDILLDRSSDFIAFNDIFEPAYPGAANEQVVFDLLQMLWDRGRDRRLRRADDRRPAGHAVPPVLLQMGFGDHQVSNFTTVTEARTIGAVRPHADPRRQPLPRQPLLRAAGDQTRPVPRLRHALRLGARRARADDDRRAADRRADPHQTVPRQVPATQFQLNRFQLTGSVPNVCGHQPCRAAVHGHELTGLRPIGSTRYPAGHQPFANSA